MKINLVPKSKIGNVFVLCSLSLFAVFLSSCSKNGNNKIGPQGGTQPLTPLTPGASNYLSATAPSPTTCNSTVANFCLYEEVASQTINVTFTPSSGTVKDLSVNLANANSQWSVDSSQCAGTISAPCNVAITYTPTSQGGDSGSLQLNYSYTNSQLQSVQNVSGPTITYQTSSLLSAPTPLTLPEGLSLSNFSQMSFSNMLPMFGLDSVNNVFYSSLDGMFSIAGMKKYELAQSNKVVLTDSTQNFSIFDSSSPSSAPIALNDLTGDTISSYAIGRSSIYGCSSNGSIYSVDPSVEPMSSTKLATLPIDFHWITSCTADTSQANDIVYSLSSASNEPGQDKYLCGMLTSANSLSCFNTPIFNNSNVDNDYIQTISVNGIYYIETTLSDNSLTKLQAFALQDEVVGPLSNFTPTLISPQSSMESVLGFSPMVYDSINNLIYVVIETKTNSSGIIQYAYQLYAIDAVNGGSARLVQQFAANETVSNPFVTKSGNVLIVSSAGKVYGFKKDGTPAFKSGVAYSPTALATLPIALNLVNFDSGTGNLNIPTSNLLGSMSTYSFNVKW